MNVTVRLHHRLRAGAVLVATSLTAVLAGCSVSAASGSEPTLLAAETPRVAMTAPASAGSLPVVLHVGGGLVTAILDESPVAREFAAMLPLRLVRLGVLDGGLDEIAPAGNRFTVWIDRADLTGSDRGSS